MPVLGSVWNPLLDSSQPRKSPDEGQVGYYKSSLANGIVVELAATEHAGFYQYSIPHHGQSSIVVDVSHVLPSFRGLGWEQHYLGGEFHILPDGHYEGRGRYDNGWNLCEFQMAPDKQTLMNRSARLGHLLLRQIQPKAVDCKDIQGLRRYPVFLRYDSICRRDREARRGI